MLLPLAKLKQFLLNDLLLQAKKQPNKTSKKPPKRNTLQLHDKLRFQFGKEPSSAKA